jgi:C-terminal processing protease CtpA/Prc
VAIQAAATGSFLSVTPSISERAESEVEGYSLGAPGSTIENQGSGDIASAASGVLSSLRHNMIARSVMIPPGKLGIVVDTTLEGPVVNKVNDASPVEGLLFPGDIIVAVDDVDTRAMSASAIYSLMKKTSGERRTIIVLSEDMSG